MGTMKEEAQAYVPPQTKNISELDKVSVDVELKDAEGKDNSGEVFKYKYIEVNGERYRVPGSVIGGMKALLKKIPNLKFITVLKDGAGMNTRYNVIPYTEPVTTAEKVQ